MRRKFVYDPETKGMVEVETRDTRRVSHFIQADIAPFASPIDGTVIGSRKKLREHMLKHDVVDRRDYVEHRKKMEADRNLRVSGKHPEIVAQRRQQINDAFERTRNEHIARGTWRG